MRLAIIDLGTNTFNLLVAESEGSGMQVIHSEELPVCLGKGGIEMGVIAPDGFGRGMEALRLHVATAQRLHSQRIAGFGTSALRNASNGIDFVRKAKEDLGLDITVIPGDEEAALILDGVRQAVTFTDKPMLVMDIGGGSIEFILATGKALMWKRSFELGVTRLRERFSPGDPIAIAEQLRIGSYLDMQLEPLFAVMERHWPSTLVGSSGSFDSLAHMMGIERGSALSAVEITSTWSALEFDGLKDRILDMSRAERVQVPGLPEHRVDTIALALIAIERVMAQGIERIVWSRYALKEGAAWRLLR